MPSKPPQPTASTSSPPTQNQTQTQVQGSISPNDPALQNLPPELTAELEAGMEDLFRQLSLPHSQAETTSETKPGPALDLPQLTEEEKKFRDMWEKLLVDGM